MATDVRYLISLQDKFSGKINTINKSTQGFDKSLGRTIARFASFAAVGAILTSSIKKIADFEEQVSNLSAITGAVGEDLDFLKGKAIELGGATTKSSIDTVKAFKLIASAKPELLTNAAALASVTKEAIALSEASGLELPEAATALTDALNQFNLSADQSSRVINILAAGSKFAAAEIPDLTTSLKEFGGVADSLNISIEESAAAVETLSSKGLKGARAGINLRNVFLKLGASTDKKLNPKIVGLSQALKNLAPIEDDITQLTKMFGRQNVLAAQTLIKQRQRVDELTDSMTGTNIAYEQQRTNTDNLNSDISRLSSSWEKLVLNLNKGEGKISNAFRNATKFATDFLDKLDEINKTEEEKKKGIASSRMEKFIAGLAPGLSADEIEQALKEEGKRLVRVRRIFNEDVARLGGAGKINRALNPLRSTYATLGLINKEKEKERVSTRENLKGLGEYQLQIRSILRDEEKRKGFLSKLTPSAPDTQIADKKGLSKVEDQVTRITSAAPKVFNITIDKFVENFTVSSENVAEGAAQVKDVFTNMWIKMLADAQAVGG